MDAIEADVLIVGGGTAGSVLAARLSESAALRVVLVEAGRDIGPDSLPPDIASAYPGRAFLQPANTWPGLRARLGGRVAVPYDQARILGGGSSINALLANRGAPQDYDAWQAAGADGWGWPDVAPVFRRIERDLDFAGPGIDGGQHHGTDGPIPVRRRPVAEWSAFAGAAAAAARSLGHGDVADQNAAWNDGIFAVATSQDEHGRRATLASVYLTAEVRARANLRILTGHRALRLIWRGGRVAGAEIVPCAPARSGSALSAAVSSGAGRMEVTAAQTVVCCGAILSPALLLRSGIGPASDLKALGIPVRHDLPGVGANLMEHPALALAGYLPRHARMTVDGGHHIHAALRFSSDPARFGVGDMHMSFVGRGAWHGLGARLGLLFLWINAPRSRGRVWLADPGDEALPEVDFRLLEDPEDLARMADGLRLAARMMQARPLRDLVGPPLAVRFSPAIRKMMRPVWGNAVRAAFLGAVLDLLPAPVRRAALRAAVAQGRDLEALLAQPDAMAAHMRAAVSGVWHPSGTCRMGRADDPMAVTDPTGAVRGVAGLRICDASLFPVIPRANTNLPVVMLAERIAEVIRSAQSPQFGIME